MQKPQLFAVKLAGHAETDILAETPAKAYRVALAAIRTLLDRPTYSPLSESIRPKLVEVGQTASFTADFAN